MVSAVTRLSMGHSETTSGGGEAYGGRFPGGGDAKLESYGANELVMLSLKKTRHMGMATRL